MPPLAPLDGPRRLHISDEEQAVSAPCQPDIDSIPMPIPIRDEARLVRNHHVQDHELGLAPLVPVDLAHVQQAELRPPAL